MTPIFSGLNYKMVTTLGFGLCWLTGGIALLGDIGFADTGALIESIVKNGGALGVLTWYLYYSTAKAQPKAQEAFAASLKSLQDSLLAEMKSQRETFREEMKAERDDNEKWRVNHSTFNRQS